MNFFNSTIILIFLNLYFISNYNYCNCKKYDKEFEYFKSVFEKVPIPFSIGGRNGQIKQVYGARAETSTNPLFVSEYIYGGKAPEARLAASVKPLVGDIKSYAGLFTVNYKYNTNIFFWFFQSKQDWTNAPLIIYVQGILMESTVYSVFEENGPYRHESGEVELRNNSWIEKYNILYVDLCPGVGFSFTQKEDGYFKIPRDFEFSILRIIFQFYQLFPELKTNDLYLASSLYGAKGTLLAAARIGAINPDIKEPIPLKGVFIGNGWIDPITQSDWTSYLFQNGYFDSKATRGTKFVEEAMRLKILSDDYDGANHYLNLIFIFISYGTGLRNLMDRTKDELDYDPILTTFVQQLNIRETIHVGPLAYQDGVKAFYHLSKSLTRPVPDMVIKQILEGLKVCLYSGQFDINVPHTHTQNLLREKTWNGSYEYAIAVRRSWYTNSKLAGYYKKSRNVTEVLVLNSGALTSRSKPEETYALLNAFIDGSFE